MYQYCKNNFPTKNLKFSDLARGERERERERQREGGRRREAVGNDNDGEGQKGAQEED